MSKITFSTLILSTLMISACGGSGGSSHSDPQPIPSTPSNSPTTTTTPSTQQEPTPAAIPSNSHTQAAEKTATSQPHQITPPTQQEPTQAATPSNSHPQAAEKTAESQAQQERPQAQRPPVTPSVPSTHLTRSDLTISQDEFKKGMLGNITVRSGDTKVGTLSGYNRTYSFNGAFKKEEGKDVQTLLVDNMAIKLIGKVSQSFAGLSSAIASSWLSAAWNATKDPTRDIFYMGSETPVENIPQHGVVTYQGNASRYDNINNQVKNIGAAKLVANFDDKTIYGELDMAYPRRNIALHQAPIVGNSFQGKAVAEGNFPFFISRDGQYEGKFFGPHAEEVAGKATFSGETLIGQVESLNTSFSAEQTK